MILLLVLALLSAAGVAASVIAVVTDGYRRVPVDPSRRTHPGP